MDKKIDWLKVGGLIATIGGAALSVVSAIVGEKQQDKIISEKIAKALAEKD